MTNGKRNDPPASDPGASDPAAGGPAAGGAEPSEAAVAEYLRRHPDFLARHSELLDVLEAPARDHGEGVVDLQQFMMDRLRAEITRLRESRDDLVHTSRINMNAQARVHQAALAILGARNFEHLIETVATDLLVILDLDAITICVEQPSDGGVPSRLRGVHQLQPGTVETFMGGQRQSVFLAEIVGEPELFGEAAGLVRSAALLRLHISDATPPAMLALGSRAPDQFEPGQGGDLLSFLARALERTIRLWLDLPPPQ